MKVIVAATTVRPGTESLVPLLDIVWNFHTLWQNIWKFKDMIWIVPRCFLALKDYSLYLNPLKFEIFFVVSVWWARNQLKAACFQAQIILSSKEQEFTIVYPKPVALWLQQHWSQSDRSDTFCHLWQHWPDLQMRIFPREPQVIYLQVS